MIWAIIVFVMITGCFFGGIEYVERIIRRARERRRYAKLDALVERMNNERQTGTTGNGAVNRKRPTTDLPQ